MLQDAFQGNGYYVYYTYSHDEGWHVTEVTPLPARLTGPTERRVFIRNVPDELGAYKKVKEWLDKQNAAMPGSRWLSSTIAVSTGDTPTAP